MDLRKQMGRQSEQLACSFLEEKGYRLLQRNLSCAFGEIDLIMQKEDLLVFVEVRSKSSNTYGTPKETIRRKKQERLRKTATYYLYKKGWLDRYYCRFDVISCLKKDTMWELEWIPDAFQ